MPWRRPTGGFSTEVDAGKVKRIRNNPSLTLQPCNLRGKVEPGSAIVKATAEVLLDDDARPIKSAIHRKYRVVMLLLTFSDLLRKIFRRPDPSECAIRLRFE